ncbi:hypothetical protein ACFYYB_29950 [Streptomyces sp. NPDC002886]|uniref:hypothetical protein n=1 Tax=Streptomyces sp. NPDC002886 TaxID=3364667 RepID=UPI0036C90D16
MSAAARPWRERRVVDGLADALREAVSERFPGSGRPSARAASAPAGESGSDRVGKAGK